MNEGGGRGASEAERVFDGRAHAVGGGEDSDAEEVCQSFVG
jgi:hypothetical protein